MKNKHLIIFFSLIMIGLSAGIYQYVRVFQTEIVGAYNATKPANGHSWSEMQCTSDLCVTDGKVGIGTDAPSQKLEVNGNISSSGTITATTDVCNGAGACLSDINEFVQNQPLVNNVHTYAACTAAGGEIVPSDVSYPMCRFNAASCPSGWTQYKNYSTNVANTCPNGSCGGCTAPAHSWSNTATGSCVYSNWQVGSVGGCSCCATTCQSTLTQIGCY